MLNVVDLDGFLKFKENKTYTVFIFLLGDEYPHLNNDSSWINYVKERIYLVRLQEEEFAMLDIGIHPKVIVFHGGKELKEYSGIPPLKTFKSEMTKLRRRSLYG